MQVQGEQREAEKLLLGVEMEEEGTKLYPCGIDQLLVNLGSSLNVSLICAAA